jgi:hypothetical protein
MSGSMRTGPAAGDPEFRGIDPVALGHVLKQMNAADRAIQGWLNAHPPPPGVSTQGYHRAQEVSVWVTEQLSMLTRRYNYAITHPDSGGGITPAPAPPQRPRTPSVPPARGGEEGITVAPPPRRPTTPKGAGGELGNFPTRKAAEKAARADALAVGRAIKEGRPIPGDFWQRLKANADDPDYTETLYDRLGPAGTADLIKRAGGDEAKLKAIRESLGTASHHHTMNVAWIKAVLAEAERDGTTAVAISVLTQADMSQRTQDALAKLGLLPQTQTRTPLAG